MNLDPKILALFKAAKPRRILVSGGEGMLGRAFDKQTRMHLPQWEIAAPGREDLDVTDEGAWTRWSEWLGEGGWLVHCAAMVNVEGCARQPEEARRVIVDGTRHAVRTAKSTGARFVYPQSFLVYDGRENPILETEEPRPLSLYGNLKKEAEAYVREEIPDALSVRMAGFFGGEERDKNFVGRIIPHLASLIQKGETRFQVGDRIWQPTFTEDLALNTLALMARDGSGLYQMACHGEASFADLTKSIVEDLGWSEALEIVTVPAAQVAQSELGRRPDCAVLSCERLRREGVDLQRGWRESLREYLARPYFDQFRRVKGKANERVVGV